jgi:prepilin-type N-terminal cleavage/methylation domain-containing protein
MEISEVTLRHKKRGFTVLELIIVIIITGVLASLAFPRYISMVERARTVEAIQTLAYVRDAQLLSKEFYGDYVPPVRGSRRVSLTPLVVPAHNSEFYNEVIAENAILNGYQVVAAMWRNDMSYHLHMTDTGLISCAGPSSTDLGICPQLGFPTPFN